MRLAYRPIEKGTIVLFILLDTSFAGRFERPRKQDSRVTIPEGLVITR